MLTHVMFMVIHVTETHALAEQTFSSITKGFVQSLSTNSVS